MKIAHTAIRAILKDPDLTAGANFGIMSWGSKFVIRTKISPKGANQILNKKTTPNFPSMTLEEIEMNTKILSDWINLG